jgi:DNA-binding LytR/AlgR family response regulator
LSREHESIDLVFSDTALPGTLQGTDVARLALKLRPPLKVLLSTGYSERLLHASEFPAGARFLPKPYRLSDLAAAVRAALDANGEPSPGAA